MLLCLLGIGLTSPAAKASFVLEYAGNPFSNTGVNCSQSQCLQGNVIVSFFVEGNVPSTDEFCLAVTTIGTPQVDCLTVVSGYVRNGSTVLPLADNPSNLATFSLNTATPSWLVYLDGLSDQNPPSQVLLMKAATTGSELLKLNDATLGQRIGRNNTVGSWLITPTATQNTPEPATWTAMAAGLGMIGLLHRKRMAAARVRGSQDRSVSARR